MLTSDGTWDLALRIHGTHSFGEMTEYLCCCPNLSQTRCHPLPWLSDQLSDPCQPFLMAVRLGLGGCTRRALVLLGGCLPRETQTSSSCWTLVTSCRNLCCTIVRIVANAFGVISG